MIVLLILVLFTRLFFCLRVCLFERDGVVDGGEEGEEGEAVRREAGELFVQHEA